MAKTTQRAFALSLAILFLITSVGFSGLVIWQMYQDSKDSSDDTAQATSQESEECSIAQQNGEVGEIPEIATVQGDVTELKTEDITSGDGESVGSGDCLLMKYVGYIANSGEVFDGNFDQPTALQFQLGGGQVIPGWDQGIEGMKVNGVRRIVIPSELAYGDRDSEAIPANSDLVFIVKVVGKQ